MLSPSAAIPPVADSGHLVDGLAAARERTLELVGPVCAEDLERVNSKLMSPLVWDLGHIAAFEDLWLGHRDGGEPLPLGDLAEGAGALGAARGRPGPPPIP